MDNREHATCPRCNRVFECQVNSIDTCQCSHIELTPAERAYIGQKYSGCLCGDCLHEIKEALQQQRGQELKGF